MTQRERSKQARRKWQRIVSEQGRSGQSVAAFCRERKLCASHFFWWKKRLGAEWPGEISGSEVGGSGSGTRAWWAIARVEVVLKNGRSLRVGPGFDAELVRALAAVLESAA